MVRTNDLKYLQNSINSLRDHVRFDRDAVVDCLDDIFAILMKMNKMKVEPDSGSDDTLILKENEE